MDNMPKPKIEWSKLKWKKVIPIAFLASLPFLAVLMLLYDGYIPLGTFLLIGFSLICIDWLEKSLQNTDGFFYK